MRIQALIVAVLWLCLMSPLSAGVPGQSFRSISNIGVNHYARKTPANSRYLPDRIIVKLRPGPASFAKGSFGVSALDMFAQQYGVRSIDQTFPNHAQPADPGRVDLTRFYTLRYNRPIDAFKVAAEFSRQPGVEYAEPWFIYQTDGNATFTPSDTSYALQWALKKIKADTAWTVSQGDTTVILAIDDTGVQWDHPDLVTNIWYNPGEMGTDAQGHDKRFNGIDDDGDGKVDDWHGWDFAGADINNPTEDNDPRPTGSNTAHGTHVSGIAAAATNNVTGIAGVGFKCRILPLKASADNDFGTTGFASIIAGFPAMIYAADMGATAVNCSWGGPGYSQYEQDVVNYVTQKGTLVIAAAGNGNTTEPSFPAAYANVISVASTTFIDAKAGYSNYGPSIDVCAPGGDQTTTNRGLYSTYYPNTYAVAIGTSQATPHVTGLAGLVHTVFPSYTAQQIGEQIRVNCDDIYALNSGFLQQLGKGRINALRALTQSSPSIRAVDLAVVDSAGGNGDGIPDPNETITLTTTFANFLQPTSSAASVSLATTDTMVQILNGSATLGTINTLQEVVLGGSTFQIHVRNIMPPDHVGYFTFNFSDPPYSDFQTVAILFNPSYRTQQLNNVKVTFTNNGIVGFHDFPNNIEGVGFVYNGGNQLFEGGLLIGNSSTGVVDVVRNDAFGQDADFLSHGIFTIHTPGVLADQEGTTSFTDSAAAPGNHLGVHVDLTSYMYSTPADLDYVLLRFDIRNISPSILTNVYAGIFTDWDMLPAGASLISAPVNYYLNNRTSFDAGRGLGYAWYDTTIATTYCGVRAFGPGVQYYGMMSDSSNATKAQKWTWLSGGNHFMNSRNDVCLLVSEGPYTITPGGVQPVGFAMIGGSGLAGLQAHADAALARWNTIFASITGNPLIDISVHQNPVFTRFADFYVSTDSVLTAPPTIVVNSGTTSDTLTPAKLVDSLQIYKAAYQFSSAGAKTLSVHAVTVGGIDTTVQRNLQVAVAQPGTAIALSDPGGDVTLKVPASAVGEETYFLAYNSPGVEKSYTFSPAREFLTPLTLEVALANSDAFRGKERFVHLFRMDKAGWTELDGWIDPQRKVMRTTTTVLGEFKLAVDEQRPLSTMPEQFVLYQNYPNPFNPQTSIRFALPADARVRIRVFNVLGQQVRMLADGQRPAGVQDVVWNGLDDNGLSVASGVYLYRVEVYDGGAVSASAARKMVLIK